MFLSCMCLRFWLDVESDSGKVGFSLWVRGMSVKGQLASFARGLGGGVVFLLCMCLKFGWMLNHIRARLVLVCGFGANLLRGG